MASYERVYRGTTPINFQAHRRHWTWQQCAEAIEAVHDDLRNLLNNFNTNDYIFDQAFSRYISILNDQQLARQHLIHTIVPRLRQVIDSEWVYCTEFLDSAETGIAQLSNQQLLPETIYVCFYRPTGSMTLASAYSEVQSIQICTDWLTNEQKSRDLLPGLSRRLRVGEEIDPIYQTLTPVLLHECLHVALPSIVDVHISRAQLPTWVRRYLSEWRTSGYIECYGERECRLLPDLESDGFAGAYDDSDYSRALACERLALKNSENITRTFVIIWLSQLRPKLDFFSDEDRQDPKIEKRRYD